MKIKLINNYLIEIEPLNYILKQSYTAKNGKEAEKVHGYFPTLADAVEEFLKLNQLDEAKTLIINDGEEKAVPVLPFMNYVSFVEEINKAAVNAITERLGAEKDCKGCVHNEEEIECLHCSRAFTDEYEGVKADD